MSSTNQCYFCGNVYSPLSGFFHFAMEFFFCFLLLFKYIAWQIFTVYRLPKFKKLPCMNCRHSAIWHILAISADAPGEYGNISAFDVIRMYKFKAEEPLHFDECLRCSISKFIAGYKKNPCYYKEFKNLDYLEYLYDKGDKK